ncbi:copper homeostasis protein CutC [Cryptosporangium sp. NPDC051539]|uniref:copper homeostasis protein CutC n=1 Tax=Cryptosporangium sp. NPDC051539 TaxID=3363962 RepID=UPI0037B980AA
MTLVEICVDDVAGARCAERAGADRVELCSGLAEGGVTPSLGLVRSVLAATGRIGVRVLVRPRGGDFVYAADELDVQCEDLRLLPLSDPRAGVVVGALTPDGEIDVAAVHRLLDAAGNSEVTFHRAFDATADPQRSLDTLIDLGVDRVLTSGGRRSGLEGAEVLRDLVQRAGGRIAVMAGGGVRPDGVRELVGRTGVPEVHLRATEPVQSAARFVNPALPYDEGHRLVTSGNVIRDLLAELDR